MNKLNNKKEVLEMLTMEKQSAVALLKDFKYRKNIEDLNNFIKEKNKQIREVKRAIKELENK